MKEQKAAIQYKEGQQMLFENSYRAIPFNVAMATLLAIYLSYNQVPKQFLITWVAVMTVISCIRMIHCKFVIIKEANSGVGNFHLKAFLFLTFLTSLTWTSIYFLALYHTNEQQLYIVILFFGGMSAGATTSLGVYFPAFLAYTMALFTPVIIFDFFIGDINHILLATSYLFFLLMISVIARFNQNLLKRMFFLTEQNKILTEKFEMLSITDALTGLYNRRHFTKLIRDEYNRAKRNQHPFALVSIDIDNFKLLNDNFGHPFGDKFIVYSAEYLKNYLRRANDIIFRQGGDEFLALLLNTTEEEVKEICNAIQTQFLKSPRFDYEPQDSEHRVILEKVGMSIGIAYVPYTSTAKVDRIIEIADQALYQAKNEGKNNIKYTKCD